MKAATLLLTLPLWLVLTTTTVVAAPTPPATPTPSPSPIPSPSPSPIPKNAFLTLDTAAGPLTTTIGVTGSQFLPGERVTLYWDPPSNKVGASPTADGNGSFTASVKPYPGDSLGLHHLCASVPPVPCAEFTVTAPLPPPPVPSPVATPSPTPSPTAAATASASRLADNTAAGLAILTKPPFVFVPIAGAAAILLAAAYWAVVLFLRRPRPVSLPSAAIVHRAARPDYTAGFGAAPEPPTPQPMPSAWAHVAPPAPAPPAVPPPPPASTPPPVYPPLPGSAPTPGDAPSWGGPPSEPAGPSDPPA